MNKFVPYGMLTFCKNCGEQNPYHRELTDEEIIQINKDEGTCWDVPDRFAILIARAILKKGSEK
jgi:hypothetical protein